MSDKLNEKFEELVTEQKVIVEAGDPMRQWHHGRKRMGLV